MKQKLVLLASILLLALTSAPAARAQWVQTNGPKNGDVLALAVSGTNLFAGTDYGVYRSTDNGTSWTEDTAGMGSQFVQALAVIGTNLFAGTQNNGVFRSTDTGKSWTADTAGVGAQDVRALAVSGTNLFAGTGGQDVYLSAYGGVYRSTDNGTSWTAAASKGLPANAYVTALAVKVSTDGRDTNLFAETLDIGILFSGPAGVYLSTDNGTSWRAADTGLTYNYDFAFAVSGTNLFAGIPDDGVYLSTDNGTSWRRAASIGLTGSALNINALAVIGTNLFAGTGSGVYLSTDNGTTWDSASTGLTGYALDINAFAVSGTNLFAGTYGSGVWRRALSEMLPCDNVRTTSLSKRTVMPGDSISALFSVTTPLDAGNVFTLQLTNGTSTFNIGSISGTTSGQISGIIPLDLPMACAGGGVHLRVAASSPYCEGPLSTPIQIENFFKPGTDYAMKFDGNSYVDLGSWFNNQTYTISMWLKPNVNQNSAASVFNFQDDMSLHQNPDGQDNDYVYPHLLQFDLGAGIWQHLTITRDSTSMRRVYLFGELIDSGAWYTNYDPAFVAYLGSGHTNSATQGWKGSMDEVKVWDRVLSDSEIKLNVSSVLRGDEHGLLGYWDFNDGCIDTVADKSPYHRTGHIIGTATRVESTVPLTGKGIIPDHAGNTGEVTFEIHGAGFNDSAIVRLVGPKTIVADTSAVTVERDIIYARFNLDKAEIGQYEVDIQNTDTTLMRFLPGVTVEAGIAPAPWSTIIGSTRQRSGQDYRMMVQCGNNGNVDAIGSILFVAVPMQCQINVDSGMLLDLDSTLRDSLSNSFEGYSVFSNGDSGQVIPIFIGRISPGEIKVLSLDLSNLPSSGFSVATWITNQTFGPPVAITRGKGSVPNSFLEPLIGPCADKILDLALEGVGIAFPPVACVTSGLNLILTVPVAAIHAQVKGEKLSDKEGLGFGWKVMQGTWDVITNCSGVAEYRALLQGVGKFWRIVADLRKGKKLLDKLDPLLNAVDLSSACGPSYEASSAGTKEGQVRQYSSYDPNEKSGVPQYLHSTDQLAYQVEFENVDTATAAAQTVSVIDTLDKNIVDLSTFSFTNFGLGKSSYSAGAPYQPDFLGQVDLRPATPLIMQVRGHLDTSTGIIKWQFTSLDPQTLEATAIDSLGFLPPDKLPPLGEGWVGYSVKFKPGLAEGTTVDHKALVVFDYNPPITTNDWPNTIDDIPPISSIVNLPGVESDSVFAVQWSGHDSISSVAGYTIMYAEDTGAFQPLVAGTLNTVDTFHAQFGHTYRFYSVAVDQAGNVQTDSTLATTTVQQGSATNGDQLLPIYPNPTNGVANVQFFLTQDEHVSIRLYDSKGSLMLTLFDDQAKAGTNLIVLNPNGLENGAYHCEMISDKVRQTRSVAIMLPEEK